MAKISAEELLIQTFIELSKEKNINKITIRELLERSGLSKPTFYKYFTDKNELVYRICYTEGRKALHLADLNTKGYEDSVRSYYESALKMDYYYQSFKYDVALQVLLYKSTYNVGMNYFMERISKDPSEISKDVKVALLFFCAGCAHIFIDWIKNNMKDAPEVIASSVIKSVPAPLLELVDFEQVF